ncbi:DUF3054 domain-containing protein [Oceanithermus sp.]|uniref:DUF3054 domain-containing protein n=1 Tax=Oceanithermus sp. TaxID=2268145 RepID=UPI00257B952B|nr:DUF3054 domain-containing protein [Oceanithermus sp.]
MAKRVWEAGVFALFAVVGALSHGRAVTLPGVLETAVPLWLAWVLTARWRDPYEGPLANLFVVWVLALPLGVVLRSLLKGSLPTPELLPFLLVAMAFTLPFMALGRRLA